jgi:hypothetical protein
MILARAGRVVDDRPATIWKVVLHLVGDGADRRRGRPAPDAISAMAGKSLGRLVF